MSLDKFSVKNIKKAEKLLVGVEAVVEKAWCFECKHSQDICTAYDALKIVRRHLEKLLKENA